ncbi:MAG TPA: hypothetical protein VHC69_27105 [Polyangiaceae bacterium]|nr:hypothetical protein [Polyangiaceae bacterium]
MESTSSRKIPGILRAPVGVALLSIAACSSSSGGANSDGTSGVATAGAPSNTGTGGTTSVSTATNPSGGGTPSGVTTGAGNTVSTNPPGAGGTSGIVPPTGTGGVVVPPFGAGGTTTPVGASGAPPAGAAGAAGTPVTSVGGAPNVPLMPAGPNCLQPGNGNYTFPGPYKVTTTDVDLGMIAANQDTGKFTIYSPDPLETACLHPIVAWGNGTGVTDSDFTYNFLNQAMASWGIVVASSAENNTGSGEFHKAGIDYLLKQNMDMTSKFFGKLSTRAGVAGHSQGGIGAGLATSHPNVVALAVEGMTFTATQKVAGLVLTGTADIVMNAQQTVTAATGPDFVAVWQGGDHVGTETVLGYLGLDTTNMDATGSQKGAQQFQRLMSAWFRCFLANDQVACKLFQGGTPDGCGICKDPGWATLASKNL